MTMGATIGAKYAIERMSRYILDKEYHIHIRYRYIVLKLCLSKYSVKTVKSHELSLHTCASPSSKFNHKHDSSYRVLHGYCLF